MYFERNLFSYLKRNLFVSDFISSASQCKFLREGKEISRHGKGKIYYLRVDKKHPYVKLRSQRNYKCVAHLQMHLEINVAFSIGGEIYIYTKYCLFRRLDVFHGSISSSKEKILRMKKYKEG